MPLVSCHGCMFARSDSYDGLVCYHQEARVFSRVHGIEHPRVKQVIIKCDEQGWFKPEEPLGNGTLYFIAFLALLGMGVIAWATHVLPH